MKPEAATNRRTIHDLNAPKFQRCTEHTNEEQDKNRTLANFVKNDHNKAPVNSEVSRGLFVETAGIEPATASFIKALINSYLWNKNI